MVLRYLNFQWMSQNMKKILRSSGAFGVFRVFISTNIALLRSFWVLCVALSLLIFCLSGALMDHGGLYFCQYCAPLELLGVLRGFAAIIILLLRSYRGC